MTRAPHSARRAGGVQQLPADAAAAGAAVHHERFQNAGLVAPLPRAPNGAAWFRLLPYEPDNGFDDRYVQVGTTFGGAAVIRGNLTPECATAVRAVLEALGKKQGPEDDRTEGKRFHDALQLACPPLPRVCRCPGGTS